MRISDWSSDVCSSDLAVVQVGRAQPQAVEERRVVADEVFPDQALALDAEAADHAVGGDRVLRVPGVDALAVGVDAGQCHALAGLVAGVAGGAVGGEHRLAGRGQGGVDRESSEEHTSALQSLMHISYSVFCLN